MKDNLTTQESDIVIVLYKKHFYFQRELASFRTSDISDEFG